MRSWQHHRAGGGRVTTPVERVQRVRQDRHTGVTARVVDGKNGSFFVLGGERRILGFKVPDGNTLPLYCNGRRYKRVCTAVEDGTKSWLICQNPG